MQRLNPKLDKDTKVISKVGVTLSVQDIDLTLQVKVARDKLIQYGFTLEPEFSVESVCKRCVEDEFSGAVFPNQATTCPDGPCREAVSVGASPSRGGV